MKLGKLTSATLVAIAMVGCSTSPSSPYRDPREVRGRTVDFTTYDFQQCVNALVDDMLSDEKLTEKIKASFGSDRKPIVVTGFENETYQHNLDSRPDATKTDKLKVVLLETMTERLLKSGQFECMDRRDEGVIVGDWRKERDGAIVDNDASASLKDARGADYILHVTLYEFREGEGRIHDVYYKMSAKLTNKKTKRPDWIGSKEIRKVSQRPIVGW